MGCFFKKRIRVVFLSGCGILLLFVVLAIYAGITNPYGQLGEKEPFYKYDEDSTGQFIFEKVHRPRFLQTPFFFNYVSLQSLQAFIRIFANAQMSEEKSIEGSARDIIARIHAERFDPSKPYVISGGHFSELYTRNLGVFYQATLDSRFALSPEDWIDRQQSITSTLALHLDLLSQSKREYTTFYQVWPGVYSGVNIYEEPSDSLFAVFYTLRAMIDRQFIAERFPVDTAVAIYPLQTKRIGKELLSSYGDLLTHQLHAYLKKIIDPQDGLIRRDLFLSSARDQIKRESSFYDNVIAWSSAQMAMQLGLDVRCPEILGKGGTCDFVKWKNDIVAAFWDEESGIFLDDLSPSSRAEKHFSADSLIVLSTRFFDVRNLAERTKLMRMHNYIVAHGFDKPLPLRYADQNNETMLFPLVRACAPSYAGMSHWSHWGMEYVKSLILLAKYDASYLEEARVAMVRYREKMEEYGGYPELYTTQGELYRTWCYKSLLHTGWVVNYEQAEMMLEDKIREYVAR